MSAIKHYHAEEAAALADLSLADLSLAAYLEAYRLIRESMAVAEDNARFDAWAAEDERRDWNRQELEYDYDDFSF